MGRTAPDRGPTAAAGKARDVATPRAVNSGRTLAVLRLVLAATETSAPYNQFSLPLVNEQQITLCTYFPSQLIPSPALTLIAGDGTLRGFIRALRAAFRSRDHDVVHAHAPHFGPLLLLRRLVDVGPRRLPSVVFTVHSSFQHYGARNKWLLAMVFACADVVVCCGQASAESFPPLFRRLAGRRLRAVSNGVDIDRVCRVLGQAQPAPAEPFTIISVGRLIEIKNPLAILEAFHAVPNTATRLVFIGDGPLRGVLEARIASLDLGSRVELLGAVPRDRVYERLAQAHLFVSMSRGEGLPVAPLEAMAAGLPVILSDIPASSRDRRRRHGCAPA